MDDKYIVYIGAGVSVGISLVLACVVIALYMKVNRINKQLKNKNSKDNDSLDSFDDDDSVIELPFNHHQPGNFGHQEPQYQQNPYNPLETFQIKRAKLMQSLRNKISNSPRESNRDLSNEYIQPISDINSQFDEDDYPHPKNGTLKNEILNARSRMSKKKPQAPKEWRAPESRDGDQMHQPREHRQEPSRPASIDQRQPPKDYPGFPNRKPSQSGNPSQFNRRPFNQGIRNDGFVPTRHDGLPPARNDGFSPPRNESFPPQRNNRGLTRQESAVMAEYDQTIASEEKGYNPYEFNPSYPKVNPTYLNNRKF